MSRASLREAILGLALAILFAGCANSTTMNDPGAKSIDAVLAEESPKLMKLPGVVGVYHGLMEDEKTEGIVVMLASADAPGRSQIPPRIGGHPVRIEVSGAIRPLDR